MKRVLKIVKWIFIVCASLFVAIQFVRPARTNPPVDQSQTIGAHTQMILGDILRLSASELDELNRDGVTSNVPAVGAR